MGIQAINNKVREANFTGTRVDLSEGSIDAQKSDTYNCILIVVTGEFSLPGRSPKLFVQTFFLAGQGNGASYYCRNSVLRLLATPTVAPTPAPAPQPVVPASVPAQHTPQPQYNAPVDSEHESVADLHAKMQVQATLASIEDFEEPAPVKPSSIPATASAPMEEPEETYEEPAPVIEEPKGPRSYLDMVKKGTAVPVSATTSTRVVRTTKPTPIPAVTPTPAAIAKSTSRSATKSVEVRNGNGANGEVKNKSKSTSVVRNHSLFLSKLPADATTSDVEQLFSGYKVNISVLAEKGFAFADFDNEVTMKEALAKVTESSVIIRNTTISIEEKKQIPKKTTEAKPGRASGSSDKATSGTKTTSGDKTASGDKTPSGERANRGPRREKSDRSAPAGETSKPPSSERSERKARGDDPKPPRPAPKV